MFRKMRRIGQQQSDEAAIEVLKNAKRGVLSVIGDDGWPGHITCKRVHEA